MAYTLAQIASLLPARHLSHTSRLPSMPVLALGLDTRQLYQAAQTLFFALRGPRHNGHDFVPVAYAKGVRAFVVEEIRPDWATACPDAQWLRVEQTLAALQKLAAFHRGRFSFPLIAITGSNGKTIVKEWLAHLLSEKYVVVKSPKSYNSQVGVPLSVWEMQARHELGIFEAGISQKGEMENLQALLRPTRGIFTNLGSAHDEGFASRTEKLREKMLLFQGTGTVIYRRGHPEVDAFVDAHPQWAQWLAWSDNPDDTKADFRISFLPGAAPTQTRLLLQGLSFALSFEVPFSPNDAASLENVSHALLMALHLGVSPDKLRQDLCPQLRPVAMRLEIKPGRNGAYLIDDSYNNDWAGLKIALDFLVRQAPPASARVAILSDMPESGIPAEALYPQLASLLREKDIRHLIGIGPQIKEFKDNFAPDAVFFDTTEAFLQSPKPDFLHQATILVKGARLFAFEKIIRQLQQQSHSTVLEIDLEALVHNLNFFRSLLLPPTRLMVMVKAFAYGSGLSEVARLLQFHRVDYLAVAYADEGLQLRQKGIQLPILVLNPGEESWDKMFAEKLEPEIYSFRLLAAFQQAWAAFGANFPPPAIHLKIDTGMRRLGFLPGEIPTLIALVKPMLAQGLRIASVFTHLAGADEDRHEAYSRQQLALFEQAAQSLSQGLGVSFLRHALNSPGIVRFPEAQMDMVRLGIGLYGIEANEKLQSQLRPIGTLKTYISQIKTLIPGQTVGYGRWGQSPRPTRIATLAIGYADGFSRRLSRGLGQVWIQGQAAPVIGNVCMDMTMVDLGDIPAQEGDEAIIFSPAHPIQDLARRLDTIPYEILTSVSERVRRVFFMP
ncbi:MAG: bifunctional UDP-N-acetylmuramoyl-tripeptide:D-alanyl-D-alanine ligase/alanine racemase [Microscillaceae bacterium]